MSLHGLGGSERGGEAWGGVPRSSQCCCVARGEEDRAALMGDRNRRAKMHRCDIANRNKGSNGELKRGVRQEAADVLSTRELGVGKIFRGLSASRNWWCVSTTMVLFLEQLS
jgi:hypothetical protein